MNLTSRDGFDERKVFDTIYEELRHEHTQSAFK